MDRARLKQIIKEELNRELSEMGRPGSKDPAPTAGHGMGPDTAGFPLGGNPSYKHHGDRYGGPPSKPVESKYSWSDSSPDYVRDRAEAAVEMKGHVSGDILLPTPEGYRSSGRYTVTVSESDIEAGYMHADVEMDDGSMGAADGDTWWDAINDAVGVAQGTGPF